MKKPAEAGLVITLHVLVVQKKESKVQFCARSARVQFRLLILGEFGCKGQEAGKGGVGSFRCQPVFVLGSIHH